METNIAPNPLNQWNPEEVKFLLGGILRRKLEAICVSLACCFVGMIANVLDLSIPFVHLAIYSISH